MSGDDLIIKTDVLRRGKTKDLATNALVSMLAFQDFQKNIEHDMKLLNTNIQKIQTYCQSLAHEQSDIKKETDPVIQDYKNEELFYHEFGKSFVSEKLLVTGNPNDRIGVKEMRDAVLDFSVDCGETIGGHQVKKIITTQGIEQKKTNNVYKYIGVKFKSLSSQEEQNNSQPSKGSPRQSNFQGSPTSFTQAGYPKSSPAPLAPNSTILPNLNRLQQ